MGKCHLKFVHACMSVAMFLIANIILFLQLICFELFKITIKITSDNEYVIHFKFWYNRNFGK